MFLNSQLNDFVFLFLCLSLWADLSLPVSTLFLLDKYDFFYIFIYFLSYFFSPLSKAYPKLTQHSLTNDMSKQGFVPPGRVAAPGVNSQQNMFPPTPNIRGQTPVSTNKLFYAC